MAVYKRTYRAYQGALTPAWSRFTVLARYGFATLFDSKPFTAYAVLCLVPFIMTLAVIYAVNNATVQALLNMRPGQSPPINNLFFLRFLGVEAWMSFILTAWRVPGMISMDFANQGIQLYLSRPISRAEYLVGKLCALGTLLSFTSWIPALLLFLVQAALRGHGWGWENLGIAVAIVISGLLGIVVVSLIAMAIAVWVRWRIAATALMMGIFFFLPAFGAVLNAVLGTRWGWLLNFGYLIVEIWAKLFRVVDQPLHSGSGLYLVPLWAAWTMLLVVCVTCIALLNRRLKAREVVYS
ncbi:MAG TPA: ABC transporter permease subunit [Candidatus Angelobacter sp.]|nr:ABC transporter permease subunit [Candidatus Angelobacter sp.]